MKYHTWEDSCGRNFEACIRRESGYGVDTLYRLEDAHYIGDKTHVFADEIDFVEENEWKLISQIGSEESME